MTNEPTPTELARRIEEVKQDIIPVLAEQAAQGSRVRDIELWRAEQKGMTKAILWIVSVAMGMPATILGLYTLLTLR